MKMSPSVSTAAFVLSAAVFSSTALAGIDITLVNRSDWTFFEIYMTASDHDYWGEDLLDQSGEVVLVYNESLTIDVPQKGRWDLKIVDEDGDECIVENVEITGSERVVLTSEIMLACYESQ